MEAQDLYNTNISILNGSSLFNNHSLDYNSSHPTFTYENSTENSNSYHLFDPSAGYGGIFFVAATGLFMVACLYMIIFLVILRFGTFVPIYDARFFRGRIYLCYGQRPCFGVFGTCNWCFVPLCLYFLLNPVREDENFNRAQEGGGLSRDERREALQELLKPMVFVLCRSAPASPTSVIVKENDHGAAAYGKNLHVETDISFGKENTASETIIMDVDNANHLVSSTRSDDPKEEAVLQLLEPGPPLSLNPSSNQSKEASTKKLERDALFATVSRFSPPYNHSTDRGLQEDNADSIMSSSVHSSGSDPDQVCSICLSEYENGSICIQANSCSHRFHRDCLLEWLEVQNNTKCPCCRKDIITNQQVKHTARMMRKTGRRNFRKVWSYLDRTDRRADADGTGTGFIREALGQTRTSETTEEFNVAGGILDTELETNQIPFAMEESEIVSDIISPIPSIIAVDLEIGQEVSEQHRKEN